MSDTFCRTHFKFHPAATGCPACATAIQELQNGMSQEQVPEEALAAAMEILSHEPEQGEMFPQPVETEMQEETIDNSLLSISHSLIRIADIQQQRWDKEVADSFQAAWEKRHSPSFSKRIATRMRAIAQWLNSRADKL